MNSFARSRHVKWIRMLYCKAKQKETAMFVILLKFADGRSKAGQFMEGHKEWIKHGLDDGVFLLIGSLRPNLGGGIIAHNTSLSDLQSRVSDDPFVVEHVVNAEILEIAPSQADKRPDFLIG
jgi:uncharacterized protein YciI